MLTAVVYTARVVRVVLHINIQHQASALKHRDSSVKTLEPRHRRSTAIIKTSHSIIREQYGCLHRNHPYPPRPDHHHPGTPEHRATFTTPRKNGTPCVRIRPRSGLHAHQSLSRGQYYHFPLPGHAANRTIARLPTHNNWSLTLPHL